MEIEKLLQIENKYDLYSIEVEGIRAWVYGRSLIWNGIVCAKKMGAVLGSSTRRKVWKQIKLLVDIVCNCVKPKKIHRNDVDVCFLCHERRVKNNGIYECMYTEELSNIFPKSVTLEKPYNMSHLKPVKNKNIIYTDSITWWGELTYLFHKRFSTSYYQKVYDEIREKFSSPILELQEQIDIDIELEKVYQTLVRKVITVRSEFTKYKKIISKIAPKVIVEVCYYSDECMIINEVADTLGIQTIELQHGIIHEDHAAYQFANEYVKIPQLPKKILTFSEYWNHIAHMPVGTELIATGFPYFEKQLCKYQKNEISNKKNILFISQESIGVGLSKLASDLDKIIDKNKYHIIYKLHPLEYKNEQWKEKYKWLNATDIEVIDNSERNLYELFSFSQFQIGVYSTAIYEGIGFELKTFIYYIEPAEIMQGLIDKGYAQYVTTALELKEKIENDSNTAVQKIGFWKTNALESITNIIYKEVGTI